MIEPTKIDRIKLGALKASLPHGALTQIANELGMTYHSVSRVFDGKWQNEAVLKRALEILEEAKLRKAELENKIDRALSI